MVSASANSHPDSDTNCNAHSYGHANTDTYGHANTDTNSDADTDTNRNSGVGLLAINQSVERCCSAQWWNRYLLGDNHAHGRIQFVAKYVSDWFAGRSLRIVLTQSRRRFLDADSERFEFRLEGELFFDRDGHRRQPNNHAHG